MKRFTMLLVVGLVVSCGFVTGCGPFDEGDAKNAWLILVMETSPEMTAEQQARTAAVLNRLFDIADVHDVRRWQTDPRIEEFAEAAAKALPPLMVVKEPSPEARKVMEEFPEYMEVAASVTWDLLLQADPEISLEDLEKFSEMSARALAEFLARTDWALEAVREQLSDPVGRRLGIEVSRAMPWILLGGGPCPIPE